MKFKNIRPMFAQVFTWANFLHFKSKIFSDVGRKYQQLHFSFFWLHVRKHP
ncbi:hypothetical protein CU034_0282 [Enterococcus faecium]|nr:hypothetical protein [Enterococcus faecium]